MENSENIEFRKAEIEDLPLLKELIQKLYKHENIIYSDMDVDNALIKDY